LGDMGISCSFGIRGFLLAIVVLASFASSGAWTPAATTAQTDTPGCAVPEPIRNERDLPEDENGEPISGRSLQAYELERVVRAVGACLSEGDFETMSQMVTERYLGIAYGGGPRMSRATFLALASALPTPPVRFRGLDDMRVLDDGEVRANVKQIVGNQLTFERIVFVESRAGSGIWRMDSTEPLRVQPPRDHSEIEVGLLDHQYSPASFSADGPTIDILLTNTGDAAHEFLLLRLAEGVTPGSLLIAPGPGLPEGAEYLAQITVPAGESTNLVLVGMKPGTYTVVDLLPNESGVPHLALGMQATLTVTD
jgi:hypothetical protein